MDFTVKNHGDKYYRLCQSGTESDKQLVFLSGPFNGEVWKHQYRYFSRKYRTIVFDCLSGGREYDKQLRILTDMIEKRDDLENVVLVSFNPGNSIVQELENREEVVATVLTGPSSNFYNPYIFKFYPQLKFISNREPKIFKKMFFSDRSSYSDIKDFLEVVEFPEMKEISSFRKNYNIRRPIKNSLIIYPEDDRWSSIEFARSINSGTSLSVIKGTGSFCFYEKPEEFNKALNDFFDGLETFVEKRKVSKLREKNMSLKEFENDDEVKA